MLSLTLRQNLLTHIGYLIPRHHFSYEECLRAMEEVGVQTTLASLRKEFSYAKKEGLIEFKTYYQRPYPILTTKGRLEIKTKLPFKHFGWDGTWKIVIFDIPENQKAKRIILQNKLLALGFGRLSRGVYLSSHPLFSAVKKLAARLKISEYLTYFKVKSIEEEKKKIARAWNLASTNEQYEDFIQKAKVATFDRKPFWPLLAKRLEQEFANLYSKDPHLPENFLPANWRGQEAYNIFKAISNSY